MGSPPLLRRAALGAALLVGCAGPLARGERQFAAGLYPDAKQTFAALESTSRRWSGRERAAYALYRGLTLGALGDGTGALVWLREARAREGARPGALSADEGRRLAIALDAIEPPAPPADEADAAARSPPP